MALSPFILDGGHGACAAILWVGTSRAIAGQSTGAMVPSHLPSDSGLDSPLQRIRARLFTIGNTADTVVRRPAWRKHLAHWTAYCRWERTSTPSA